jgi:hypothetical protein
MNDTVIWWLDRKANSLVKALGAPFAHWPDYIQEGFEAQDVSGFRSRIWVALGLKAKAPMVEEAHYAKLRQVYGTEPAGIVLNRADLWLVAALPGFITDQDLQVVQPAVGCDKPYVIWWSDQKDCEAICALQQPEAQNVWPEYIDDQFDSRYGRAGNGRLWTAEGIELTGIPWKEHDPLYQAVGKDSGGIVIRGEDVGHVAGWPGFVADADMKPLTLTNLAVTEVAHQALEQQSRGQADVAQP